MRYAPKTSHDDPRELFPRLENIDALEFLHASSRRSRSPGDICCFTTDIRKAKYDLDEEVLRPYSKLENVVEGAFAVANRLYGIHFVERIDIPRYHEDAKVFEVTEADGSHLGILRRDTLSDGGHVSSGRLAGSHWFGSAQVVDEPRIVWPNGVTQVLTNVSAGQYLEVTIPSAATL